MTALEAVMSIVLWLVAIAFLASGHALLIAIALAWTLAGVWMARRSQTRGYLADLSFVVTWPVYVMLER